MQPGLSYNDLGRWAKSQFSLTPSLTPPSKAGVCRIVKMEDKLQALGSESQAEKHLLSRRSLLLDVMQLETITFIEGQRGALSCRRIIGLGAICASRLRVPSHQLPSFTRRGWFRHFKALWVTMMPRLRRNRLFRDECCPCRSK